MTDRADNREDAPDDMAEYLQTFLDETEEQLDDLVEIMLVLERDPTNHELLNEAFRLIHSIKGAAGIMAFNNITVLTHHLENRFERFRSGTEVLDEPTMNVVLRCIDFVRQCNHQLRGGKELGSPHELLEELQQLEMHAHSQPAESAPTTEEAPVSTGGASDESEESKAPPAPIDVDTDPGDTCMLVRFSAGLQLTDLKAQLIVARLSGLGDICATRPAVEQLAELENLETLEVWIQTEESLEGLRAAADVDGVESIAFPGSSPTPTAAVDATAELLSSPEAEEAHRADRQTPGAAPTVAREPQSEELEAPQEDTETHLVPTDVGDQQHAAAAKPPAEPSADAKTTTKVAETMRVDIDRLDKLMNLAGELVVNRARFIQVAGELSPQLQKGTLPSRIRDVSDVLQRTIDSLEKPSDEPNNRSAQIQQLRTGLQLMAEQAEVWEKSRDCFGQMNEAIDQLSRVSQSLQRGVLDTRMVPVAPLFHRFKRVVRDLSKERGKRVHLEVHGEKTELDKRMIDELGDPLVHLVRNSIDHGLEATDVRVARNKSEEGTIFLSASHSGNNVSIQIRDDGGGIDVDKIKAKLIGRGILSESAVADLSRDQVLDYIWHPGFSTAQQVTDVSGRGVGMDVVKNRIGQLNGTIEVQTEPQQGTTFTLQLPLTLAIIDSLLVRLRNVVFSLPTDNVREIVSVHEKDIFTVQGKQTFEVRGEFLPLVRSDEFFHWQGVDDEHSAGASPVHSAADRAMVEVVILQSAERGMGLRVDELLGNQDVVIKSFSANFMPIRGLSGASILGDGSVALMLDVGSIIEMACRPTDET